MRDKIIEPISVDKIKYIIRKIKSADSESDRLKLENLFKRCIEKQIKVINSLLDENYLFLGVNDYIIRLKKECKIVYELYDILKEHDKISEIKLFDNYSSLYLNNCKAFNYEKHKEYIVNQDNYKKVNYTMNRYSGTDKITRKNIKYLGLVPDKKIIETVLISNNFVLDEFNEKVYDKDIVSTYLDDEYQTCYQNRLKKKG